MSYIPLDKCEDGAVYRIDSRNLAVGVFVKERNGFIGIRTKFGSEYLFTEFHWDTGEPFGTVQPLEKLAVVLPAGVRLVENVDTIDEATGRPVAFDKPVAEGGKGWYFVDTLQADKSIRAISVENRELFDFLDRVETELELNKWRLEQRAELEKKRKLLEEKP